MDAATLVRTLTDELHGNPPMLPQQVTVELQTERSVDGPIVPQHHVSLQRQPMSLDAAQRLFEQLAAEPPVAFSGGVALNPAMVTMLQKCLHVPLRVAPNPQLTAALGAALLAAG